MKNKMKTSLTWGFSIVPLFATLFQAIIEQNLIVLASIYLGVLAFLIIEFLISGANVISVVFQIMVAIIVAITPVIAIKMDLLKIKYKKAKIQKLQKKIDNLEFKLKKLKE